MRKKKDGFLFCECEECKKEFNIPVQLWVIVGEYEYLTIDGFTHLKELGVFDVEVQQSSVVEDTRKGGSRYGGRRYPRTRRKVQDS